jgi:hypothetical protein
MARLARFVFPHGPRLSRSQVCKQPENCLKITLKSDMPRSFRPWRALVRVSAEYPPITEVYADEVIIDLPKATFIG